MPSNYITQILMKYSHDSHVLNTWLIFKGSQVHVLKPWGFKTLYLLLLKFPSVKIIPPETCSNEKKHAWEQACAELSCSQLKSSVNSCFSQQRTRNVTIQGKSVYAVKLGKVF